MLRRLLPIQGRCSLRLSNTTIGYIHSSAIFSRDYASAALSIKQRHDVAQEPDTHDVEHHEKPIVVETISRHQGKGDAAHTTDTTHVGLISKWTKSFLQDDLQTLTIPFQSYLAESILYKYARDFHFTVDRRGDKILLKRNDDTLPFQAHIFERRRIKSQKLATYLARRPEHQLSSVRFLEDYLQETDSWEKLKIWRSDYQHYWHLQSSPLGAFLLYLKAGRNVTHKGARHLKEKFDLTIDDLARCEFILDGNDADRMAQRHSDAYPRAPAFVLLFIIRRDIHYVESLYSLLRCIWDMVRAGKSKDLFWENDVTFVPVSYRSSNSSVGHKEQNRVSLLMLELVHRALQLWPAALVSIAHLFCEHVRAVVASASLDLQHLDEYHHRRLSRNLNSAIHSLGTPARVDPLKSAIYNWSAQKVLLELAGQTQPALLLDQRSYRAVVRVLGGLQKTSYEAKSATLRTRTWPPWRVYQDGMDAQRTPGDDFSRVTLALARMKEAGYSATWSDDVISIMGGLEPDGTPTIQQRIFKPRSLTPKKAGVWAARINSTRDVREAWGAFQQFVKNGGTPDSSMYLAMFEKLNAESARLGRRRKYNSAPGEGKEVLPVPDINFSPDYLRNHQPPTWDSLYDDMINSNIRLSGELLEYLVEHARTFALGFRYLVNAGVDVKILDFLRTSRPGTIPSPQMAKDLTPRLLKMFITLVCRFPSYVVPGTSDQHQGTTKTEIPLGAKTQWREMRSIRHTHFPGLSHPLYSIALLLTTLNPSIPSWYRFFETLGRRDIVVVSGTLDRAKTHHLAWQIMRTLLSDFLELGRRLDSLGILRVCNVFARYARTLSKELREPALKDSQVLVEEFSKLCTTTDMSFHMPRLLHTIRGVHLHAYLRCLSLVHDQKSTLKALTWMVEHESALREFCEQDKNSYAQYRKALVNIRLCCAGTEYDSAARELVETVSWWGGWPGLNEVEQYMAVDAEETMWNEEPEEEWEDETGEFELLDDET